MRIHFMESPVDKIHPNRIVHKGLQIMIYSYTGEGLSKPVLLACSSIHSIKPISEVTLRLQERKREGSSRLDSLLKQCKGAAQSEDTLESSYRTKPPSLPAGHTM